MVAMKLIPNLADIDRKAILQYGIPAVDLMERAGSFVADAVMRMGSRTDRVVVLCGPGNNGGDGFVCARLLHRAGYSAISTIYTGNAYKGEALVNLEALMGLPVELINSQSQPELASSRIRHADILVDALFGSGLARPVGGLEGQLIQQANAQATARVVAVDIPSGVDGATGNVQGLAIRADETVTFAVGKPGLYLQPGKTLAGRVRVVDIGIPPDLIEGDESPIRLMDRHGAAQFLPKRDPAGHKYSFGSVLVVAGSEAMPGAAVLTAEAALAAGAGLVTLASVKGLFTQIAVWPEVIRMPLPQSAQGALDMDALPVLQSALQTGKYHVLALGPGLGQHPETIRLVGALLAGLPKDLPAVIDADGLNALSQLANPGFMPEASRPGRGETAACWLMTPHLGEAARLLQCEKSALEADLLKAARDLQLQWGASMVLKSASTVIATPDGLLWLSPTGNSGMATAGSGDVLTGILAGLAAQMAAQGQSVAQAAPLGAYLHGLAGDAAAEALTPYVMKASDITRHLPIAFRQVMATEDRA